jgi:hypothetical protein
MLQRARYSLESRSVAARVPDPSLSQCLPGINKSYILMALRRAGFQPRPGVSTFYHAAAASVRPRSLGLTCRCLINSGCSTISLRSSVTRSRQGWAVGFTPPLRQWLISLAAFDSEGLQGGQQQHAVGGHHQDGLLRNGMDVPQLRLPDTQGVLLLAVVDLDLPAVEINRCGYFPTTLHLPAGWSRPWSF